MNATVASLADEWIVKFPSPGRKSQCLCWARVGSTRLSGCAEAAWLLPLPVQGRIAWLRSLNRPASCKLSSSFSAFVKELHQVGEEIPGRQALEEMPGTCQSLHPGGRLEKSDATW